MSGYGGMSTSGSKNQSMSNSGFNSATQLAPEQVYELKRLWAQINGMIATDYAGRQRYQDQASQNAIDVYNQAMPAWQQQLQGGAFSDFDVNRFTDNLYDSMNQQARNVNQFENMQNRQRGKITRRTENKIRKLTSKKK